MKRTATRSTILVAALACGGLLSCAKGGSGEEPAGTGGTAGPRAAGYDIHVSTRDEGCADVAEFFARLQSLPDGAWVRRHTVSFKPSAQNEDGTKPRTNFLSVLAFSSFEITERRMGDFRAEIGTVEQSACQSVRFTEPGVGASEFMIRATTPNSIQLGVVGDPADPAKDSIRQTLEWVGPRELRIRTSYLAMDMCPDYKVVRVERTQSLQWGPEEFMASATTADVDPVYIGRATKPLAAAPGGLTGLAVEEAVETEAAPMQTTAINVSELRRLRDSQIRTDMKVCPYRAKPPTGDEPPPPEDDAAPTPTPAPDTGANPIPETQTGG